MRVLMIAPEPFFAPRGTPISVYQRLHGLSELGHEVDLVTYPIGKAVHIPNVTIYRAPSVWFIKHVRTGPSLAKIPLDILLFFTAFWRLLVARVQQQPYDVIHSHEEASFFSVILAALFGTKHLYDMHSSLPRQLENYNFGNYRLFVWLFQVLERWVLHQSDVILTIGHDLQEYVLSINGEANHLRIENTASHISAPPAPGMIDNLRQKWHLNGRLPIVYTGSFERYQGIELLVDSAALVVPHHPEICFVIVGGKPEDIDQCRRAVAKRDLADYFIFTGIVDLEEALCYLEVAEILVSPRTDGLSIPLKIYSYMQSGKPMVATDIPAHKHILTGETAVLTRPTAEAYAAGLCYLLENPDTRRQIGDKARTFAQAEFSHENYLARLERAYRAMKYARPIQEIPRPEIAG